MTMIKMDISLRVDGLKLVGEVCLPETRATGRLPALCLCHGIPARAAVPGDQGYPLLAKSFCELGLITMIFNFRGAGLSEGNFDMLGWARDLEAAIDYLHQLPEVDSSRLLVMGFSGGAATAVYVAARDERIRALVTCAGPARFTMVETKEGRGRFLQQAREVGIIKDVGFPASEEQWAASFAEISPAKWISRISPRPLLIIHGEADELIPVSQARELYRKAGQPKELALIPGAGHRLRLDEKAMDIARGWVNKTAGI